MPEFRKRFRKCWTESKHEIFRLQLLDTYLVDDEKEAFSDYKKGKAVSEITLPGDDEWLSLIEDTTKKGVKIIDMEVVSIPLSEYKRFVIPMMFSPNSKGQESLFVERKKIAKQISGFQDYWMFDSKIVIPMNYDKEGHFFGSGDIITEPDKIARYVKLKEELLKVATPMSEFLHVNKVNLDNPRLKIKS